jgi:ABC-type antimicrobial peptide transport system permease subunit
MENVRLSNKIGAILFGLFFVGVLIYIILYALSGGFPYQYLQKKQGFANSTEIWFMSHPLEGMLVAIVGAMAVIFLIALFFARKHF